MIARDASGNGIGHTEVTSAKDAALKEFRAFAAEASTISLEVWDWMHEEMQAEAALA